MGFSYVKNFSIYYIRYARRSMEASMEAVFTIKNANTTVRFGTKVYVVEKKNPLVYPSKKI